MITIEVNGFDINKALSTLRNSPLELAVSRTLKIDLERIEVKHNKVIVWMYDDADHLDYHYADEESVAMVEDFISEWEAFLSNDDEEEFLVEPFSIRLELEHDPRTESRHWTATSIDYSGFTDRPSSDKKNLKFRLTDDDE